MTRTGKNCSLKVTDPTGTRSGQRLLDSFVEKLALDLPKFMQSSDRYKASIILRALGIEDRLNDIERREKAAYDSRRDASVRLDIASKAAQAMPEYPNVPEQPVSVRELLDELAENDSRNAVIAKARQAIAAASECIASNETSRALLLEQIDALRQRIAALDEDDVRQRQVIDSNSDTADAGAVRACKDAWCAWPFRMRHQSTFAWRRDEGHKRKLNQRNWSGAMRTSLSLALVAILS